MDTEKRSRRRTSKVSAYAPSPRVSTEPAATRAWALPTFGRVGLAKGCGGGKSAIMPCISRPMAMVGWNEKLPEMAVELLFVEGGVTS